MRGRRAVPDRCPFVALAGLVAMTSFCVATLVSARGAASLSGATWEGLMHRGGDSLPVRFAFSGKPAPTGTFSAEDLGAIDIPLKDVRLGKSVHWKLVGDTTTTVFDGTQSGGAIVGRFRENGRAGTFELHRVTVTPQRAYEKRDVTFANGNVRLAGTLFVPLPGGPHPAIVFVQGSGDEGRWASAYLADYVARRGIIALTYDKRGVGGSAGSWRTSTLPDLADDARAAVQLLAATPGVDRSRIGVYGHSEGGEIAPAIAQDDPLVGFVIDADGPVGPEYLQDLFRVDNILARHYSGEDLSRAERLYAEFVDVARSGARHDRLRADIAAAGNAPWVADLQIPEDGSWIWSWYRGYGNYDNRTAWANVHVPVLILFGGQDTIVPVQSSIDETAAILRAHGDKTIEVHVFERADHTLHVPPSSADGWPHLPAGFPEIITTFVSEEARNPSPQPAR